MFKVLVQPNALIDKSGKPINFVFTSDPSNVPSDQVGIVCNEDTLDSIKKIFESIQATKIQLMVETKTGWEKLSLDEIIYFESYGPEITIHRESKSPIIITEPLYQIEEVLNDYHFARIAKSYIVNLSKIQSIQIGWNAKLLLNLGLKQSLEVTRSFVPSFKKRLGI